MVAWSTRTSERQSSWQKEMKTTGFLYSAPLKLTMESAVATSVLLCSTVEKELLTKLLRFRFFISFPMLPVDFQLGSTWMPLLPPVPSHLIVRPVRLAHLSTRSCRPATICASSAFGFHMRCALERRVSKKTLSTEITASLRCVRSLPQCSLSSLSAPSSKWSSILCTKSRAANASKPLPATITGTIGMPRIVASRISSKHHGRWSTPFVQRSTRQSDWWTPWEKSARRSVSSDESRKTGAFSILRNVSCM
mmetsp:Transcript_17746/g.38352  ORF Transcript_17746/g.38352 Transcript_17746/m.38352 type:complete len:251 (+) Transcript_17746:376-1128(+)